MVRVRHAVNFANLALEPRRYRRLSCIRLEIALADLVQVRWLQSGRSGALIGKDVE